MRQSPYRPVPVLLLVLIVAACSGATPLANGRSIFLTGRDANGNRVTLALDPATPRWRLSRRDLHDVADYVLTQLK